MKVGKELHVWNAKEIEVEDREIRGDGERGGRDGGGGSQGTLILCVDLAAPGRAERVAGILRGRGAGAAQADTLRSPRV